LFFTKKTTPTEILIDFPKGAGAEEETKASDFDDDKDSVGIVSSLDSHGPLPRIDDTYVYTRLCNVREGYIFSL